MGLPPAPDKPWLTCDCPEGFIETLDKRGKVIGRTRIRAPHDCEYLKARRDLVREADRIVVMATISRKAEERGYVFSKAMNDLARKQGLYPTGAEQRRALKYLAQRLAERFSPKA